MILKILQIKLKHYVQCHGAVTTAKLKVANAALTHFSITLVKNGHHQDEYKTPLQFAQAQHQPNVVAQMLQTLFSHFRKNGLTFSLSKDFNGKGMLIVFRLEFTVFYKSSLLLTF